MYVNMVGKWSLLYGLFPRPIFETEGEQQIVNRYVDNDDYWFLWLKTNYG